MSVLGRRLILALLLAACPAAAWANIAGAVFTTDNANPGTTNVNLYQNRQDVYVNGGPRQPGSAGLPVGFYHIQVTTPDGAVLGTSYLPTKGKTAPVIEVVPIVGGNGGKFKEVYKLWEIVWYIKPQNGQLCQGYLPTTNTGNEYKIWVSMDPSFPNAESKTDNFKVRNGAPLPQQVSIVAYKFYDSNGNGFWDLDEVEIPNWQIQLKNGSTVLSTLVTDGSGRVEWFVPLSQIQYTVCEIIPAWEQPNPPIVLDPSVPDPEWVNTTPLCVDAVADQNRVVQFGNRVRYYQPVFGLGRTKGFWQSTNGRDKLAECELHREPQDPHWWEGLNALNLVWPDDQPFTITANNNNDAHAQLASWLVGVGAIGNPKYILGTQLAALWLNVNCGFMSGLGVIYFSFDDVFFASMAKKMLGSAEDELGEAADLLDEDGSVYGDDMLDFADLFDDINNNEDPVYVETTGDALALLTAFKY